nr:uncharacterized protein LOC109148057 [Ipomoea batatas]
MGNCLETSRKSTAEIAPADVMKKNQPTVKLYGAPFGIETYYIRFALLYKPVSLKFLPSDRHDAPVIEYKSDSVSGSPEVMVQFLDAKFPEPQLLKGSVGGWYGETTPLLVWVVTLQHRSILWHLDRMVRWAEDLSARGGKTRGDPAMGSPRMEIRKFGKSYSQLLELLQEHAQMEERVVFPILEKADRVLIIRWRINRVCEVIDVRLGLKPLFLLSWLMKDRDPVYQEALFNLSNSAQKLYRSIQSSTLKRKRGSYCPYWRAAELSKTAASQRDGAVLGLQCTERTPIFFRFFMEGLLPQDAMQYMT